MSKQGKEKAKIDLQPMLRIKNSTIRLLNNFKPINLIPQSSLGPAYPGN